MKKNLFIFLLFIAVSLSVMSQTKITGVVTAESGEALPGATVLLKGTTVGTVTDVDGNYSLEVKDSEGTLVISYVGYTSKEIPIVGQSAIDVALAMDIASLDEIIVIGYGVQKKSLVTGAISKITSDEITQTQNLRVEQALQGKTAGITVFQESGSPGAAMKVRIRGIGTNGDANPLYIVDGIRTGGIDYLSTSDIESIEVLKDAASAAIYGSDAANGVVLITTKKGKKGVGEVVYNGYYGIQDASHYTKVMNAEQYINYYSEAYAWEKINASGTDDITEINDPNAIDNAFSKFPYIFENGNIYQLQWEGVTDPKSENNATLKTNLGKGTDWMEELINPAPITSHTLSASGGSDAGNYYLSGGYFNQQGIIGGDQSNYDRYNFRFNGVLNTKDWISFYTNIGYTFKERTWIGENDWFSGDVTSASRLDPLTPVYADSTDFAGLSATNQKYLVKDDDGKYYAISQLVTGENANPLASIKARRTDKWKEDKLVGGAGFDLKPIKDLKIHSSIDIDLAHALQTYYAGNYYLSNDIARIPGANDVLDDGGDPLDEVLDSLTNGINLTYQTYKWLTIQNENYITYSKQIGSHNFTILGGNTIFQYTNLEYNVTKPGLYSTDEKWLVFNNYDFKKHIDQVNMWGEYGTDRLLSYYGRLSYNYDEKYIGTVNFRADGSSKFGENNKFGYFPSFSGGWVISREGFYPQDFIVNLVKLRGSYGINGSNNLERWKYLDLVRLRNDGGTERAGVYNPDLRWEKSIQTDVALDLALLRNKITITTDYFIKTTDGLLLETSVLASEGEGKTVNAGEIQNTGVELEIGFHNKEGLLHYDIGINGSFIKNEVTSLDENRFKKLAGANIMGHTVTNFELGKPVWYLYGYKTDGIFQNWEDIDNHISILNNDDGTIDSVVILQPNAKPGEIKYLDIASKDTNGNIVMIPDGVIDESDRTLIGNPHPDFTFGLNANLEFFNFDLSMFWQGVYGNEIYLYPRTERAFYNRPLYMYDERWTGEGTTNDGVRAFSAETVGKIGEASDFWVYDGSYVRLKQISIGYTIPNNITSKIQIQKLRIYFSANNVLTFTKYPGNDPEVGGTTDNANSIGVDLTMYPSAKSYIFGLNLVF
ncbi:SusC/RagA family TonB-linked outer membrane protein [Bacteroidota bacterium]